MVDEIQKTFLLKDFSLVAKLKNDGIELESKNIRSFYTEISSKKEIRFKSINKNKFFKITLLKNDLPEEKREKISKKEFLKAKEKAITTELFKRTYTFSFCSLKSCIEFYDKQKFCILRITFPTLELCQNFALPREFGVVQELKIQSQISSKILTLYGFEDREFDIEKCLKIIDKNQNFTLDFPSYIRAFDGLKILLFYLFKRLKTCWTLALENKELKYFENFYIEAKILCIILSSFDEIFDKNLSEALAFKFENLAQKTRQILNESEKKVEALLFLLSSENLNDLFYDFDAFIKEGTFYEGLQKDIFFKQIVAFKLRKKLILFKKIFFKGLSHQEFELKFMELSIFLEYFSSLFDLKVLEKLKRKYFNSFDESSYARFGKKRDKISKLINKISQNLKIYKG